MAPNISGWRLNAAEREELTRRVKEGESEALVKRELQTKKAEANEERKKAAKAVSQKAVKQQAKAKAKSKAAAKSPAVSTAMPGTAPDPDDDALDDAANKAYYCKVHEDMAVVLAEFGEDFRKEKPLTITAGGGLSSGVQEPYDSSKALQALAAHGIYRCSISIWWVNALASPTPGIPMARKRVEDLTDYYFGVSGEPRFHSDKMFEVALLRGQLTDEPANLQLISPEEMLHATFAGCVRAIEILGNLVL